MTAKIELLIEGQDTSETVRDAVAAILTVETAQQAALAQIAGKDERLWQLRVFTERALPWSEWLEEPDPDSQEDTTPIVNVWLDSAQFRKQGSDIGQQRATATFNVDVFAVGVSREEPLDGHIAGDREAAFNCQRAARLVRRILMAAHYQFLGSQRGAGQVVFGRWLSETQFYQPQVEGRAIQRISAARLRLEVDLVELCQQVVPSVLDELLLTVRRETATGQIYLRALYPEP